MTQLSKIEERNKKLEEINKQRRNKLKNNLLFVSGASTSTFTILAFLIFLIGNVAVAAIISLLVCILITKLIFLNRENKIKYRVFMNGFLIAPTILLLGKWDEDMNILLYLIWIAICFYFVKKIYAKL